MKTKGGFMRWVPLALIVGLVVVMPALFMTGCATSPETAKAVLEAQAKMRPTLAVTCPAGGCSVEYTDPRDRGGRLPTNGWDAAIAVGSQVTGLVSGAVPYAAIGAVAVQGLKHAGHNTQTSNVASGAGSSTAGPGSYNQIGPDSNNTTTTDSHDTANSNNSAADSHDSTVDSHNVDSHAVDNTAPPTVVDPVVVQPVVVQTGGVAP